MKNNLPFCTLIVCSSKKKDTPIIEGYRIYHNFIRGHEAFDGKTPADMASIKVEGKNKWITIIQNARLNYLK